MKYLLLILLPSIMFAEGLKLQKELDSGYSANHWDIASVEIDYPSNQMIITVYLYKDKANKEAGKRQIQSKRFETEIPAKVDKDTIFSKLKELDEFSGAIND